MRTVDSDVGADQLPEHARRNLIGGDAFDGSEWQRVMGDNQVGAAIDCFRRTGRSNGQAGHDFACLGVGVACEQANIVPVFGEACWSELVEEIANVLDVGHEFGFQCQVGTCEREFGLITIVLESSAQKNASHVATEKSFTIGMPESSLEKGASSGCRGGGGGS